MSPNGGGRGRGGTPNLATEPNSHLDHRTKELLSAQLLFSHIVQVQKRWPYQICMAVVIAFALNAPWHVLHDTGYGKPAAPEPELAEEADDDDDAVSSDSLKSLPPWVPLDEEAALKTPTPPGSPKNDDGSVDLD